MGPQLGFSISQGILCFQGLKWFSWFSIDIQACLCRVSILASQVCSINGSDDWKSTALGKKSIMVNIQSNLNIYGQHQHFEVIFIILSKVDHDSSRNALKSSKVKSCQIRVSLGEVNWTLTKHNFHMLHQLLSNKISFEGNSNL